MAVGLVGGTEVIEADEALAAGARTAALVPGNWG